MYNTALIHAGAFDRYVQDAVYSLPTFEDAEDESTPPHLRHDPRMCEAMVARLMLSKNYDKKVFRRKLTCQIWRTMDFIAAHLCHCDDALRPEYTVATATVTAHALPFLEIVRSLKLEPADLTYSDDSTQYALAAAVHLGRPADVVKLLELGANVDRSGTSYGHCFSVAAQQGHDQILSLLLDTSSQDSRANQWREHHIIEALYEAATAGHTDTAIFLLHCVEHGSDVFAKVHVATTYALQASQRQTALSILAWRKNNLPELSRYPTFMMPLPEVPISLCRVLQIACSTNSKDVVEHILHQTPITYWGGSLNIALEDACRSGHSDVVELLLSISTNDNLTSYSDALFWAARRNHHDSLLVLLNGIARSSFVGFVDALAGAVFADESTMSFLLDLRADYYGRDARMSWPTANGSAGFVQIVDALLRSKAPSVFSDVGHFELVGVKAPLCSNQCSLTDVHAEDRSRLLHACKEKTWCKSERHYAWKKNGIKIAGRTRTKALSISRLVQRCNRVP